MTTEGTRFRGEERLAAACLLSMVGGFTDAYSFLCRGHVFANAVTGNMVMLGMNAARGAWSECAVYLLAVASYGCGIFTADAIHARLDGRRLFDWHQAVLAVEVALLAAVCLTPCGAADFAVNAAISFVCALQVQAFRRVRGLPFASTMCTGNLRSGADALFNGLRGADPAGFSKARHYMLVIALFVAGAALGSALISSFGPKAFALAPAALLAVLALLAGRRVRRLLRLLLRRPRHSADRPMRRDKTTNSRF